ncbi:hypothetical protein KIPB_004832 [Kipferlia bialata]|uniref:Exonuclease domain-containing protein n=1 Tax=Kipferlia bialata TaxID=797122 RepID=A0A9K3CWB3_9EUKA|nr:hypothetical protein KIPB_004832 [Kipferlia bialata]|eukprot:g4832.t1
MARGFSLFSGKKVLALDVECVANGKGHNDRVPCWVVIVNEKGRVLLDLKIKVTDMVSPLTRFSGVTAAMLRSALPLDTVMRRVHKVLNSPAITLVGQSIENDIAWLGLEKGVHYGDSEDIAEHFRTYNEKYKDYNYFSLVQTAYGLLGTSIQSTAHSPIEDAKTAMRLYVEWIKTGRDAEGGARLTRMRYKRQFPQETMPTDIHCDGVCGAKYQQARCICGQPCVERKRE